MTAPEWRCDPSRPTGCDEVAGSVCLAEGRCAHADRACPSGYRYNPSARRDEGCVTSAASLDAGPRDVVDANAEDVVDAPDVPDVPDVPPPEPCTRAMDGTCYAPTVGCDANRCVKVDLVSIRGTARDDLWVIGRGGTAWRGDGNTWRFVPVTTPDVDLTALAVSSRDLAFATAANGVTYRWDSDRWVRDARVPNDSAPAALVQHGAWSQNGDVWTGGDMGSLARRFVSGTWSVADAGDATWRAVGGFSTGVLPAVWLVGDRGAIWFLPTGLIQGSTGARSFTAPRVEADLFAVQPTGRSTGWVAGQGVFASWVVDVAGFAITWTNSPAAETRILRALWAPSDTEAWAVGDDGVVLHAVGTSTDRVTTRVAPGAPSLRGVWGVAGGAVWAVGDRGTIVRVDAL
ncbi:MAG: hypothetical protein R3A52_08655 [Polyangiales bacterium]